MPHRPGYFEEYYQAHKSEYAERDRRNRERYQQYRAEWHRLKKYSLTPAQYDALVVAQGDRCALCHTDNPGGRGAWHVDHDKATGRVRGLLCFKCNTGIGSLKHDPGLLRLAAEYLELN